MLLNMLEKSPSLQIGSIPYYNSKTHAFSHLNILKSEISYNSVRHRLKEFFQKGLVLALSSHLGELSTEYCLIFLLGIVWTTLMQGISDCRLTQVLACDSNYQARFLFLPTSSAKVEACNFICGWDYALISLALQAFGVSALHEISQTQMFYLLYQWYMKNNNGFYNQFVLNLLKCNKFMLILNCDITESLFLSS